MRGESHLNHLLAPASAGSPPHAWGEPARAKSHCALGRFTPTCVGKAPESTVGIYQVSVHPHMRGESRWQGLGSITPAVHPHMRGDDVELQRLAVDRFRFTPTCVGTTSRYGSPRRRRAAVHPHVRGDDALHSWASALAASVHPHMRGDDACDCRRVLALRRFTPTCVGTTSTCSRRADRCIGSPPHAWGRRCTRDRQHRRLGSPPHAWGRLTRTSTEASTRSVHPHMRGDDQSAQSSRRYCVGSPPHAWGRRRITVRRCRRWPVHPHMRGDDAPASSRASMTARFTPTCVGTTASSRTTYAASYSGSPPHAWGRRRDALAGLARRGSPPHAWGRPCPRTHDVPRRFTPTCVGTTFSMTSSCCGVSRFTPTCVGKASYFGDVDGYSVHPHMRGETTPRGRVRSRPVHPHMRGDDGVPARRRSYAAVHPHMRGDDMLRSRSARGRRRFTPTCVGTTHAMGVGTDDATVHPHMRGDDLADVDALAAAYGSPPHAWGRRDSQAATAAASVHPHMRGDDGWRLRWRRAVRRFTPTCVGKAAGPCVSDSITLPVHPHMRGESRIGMQIKGERVAVHPHMRGESDNELARQHPTGRFTPTCVGKATRFIGQRNAVPGSPPHAWGKRVHSLSCQPIRYGSPPHAWGRAEYPDSAKLLVDRFTPTCVGKAGDRRRN